MKRLIVAITGAMPPTANIDNNLYYTPNGTPVYVAGQGNYSWSDWRGAGYEPNGLVAYPVLVSVTLGETIGAWVMCQAPYCSAYASADAIPSIGTTTLNPRVAAAPPV